MGSQYELESSVKALFPIVEPIEYVLGRNPSGKVESFQYVPILKTVEEVLSHDDIFAELWTGHSSEDGQLRDICDVELAQNHELFNDHRNLQLIL